MGFDVGLPAGPAAVSSQNAPRMPGRLQATLTATRGFLAQPQVQRRFVQTAGGRGSGGGGGGRTGGGGASGGGRGGARDPADDMDVCQNLEDLQALISQRLSVWERKKDVVTMCAAFSKCGNVSLRGTEAHAPTRALVLHVWRPYLG